MCSHLVCVCVYAVPFGLPVLFGSRYVYMCSIRVRCVSVTVVRMRMFLCVLFCFVSGLPVYTRQKTMANASKRESDLLRYPHSCVVWKTTILLTHAFQFRVYE